MAETLQKAVQYLTEASVAAQEYLCREHRQAAGIEIQVEFLQSKMDAVVRIVNALKKAKEAIELPDEWHTAHILLRTLKIDQVELQAKEKQLEQSTTQRNEPQGQKIDVSVSKPIRPPLPIPMFDGTCAEYGNFITLFDKAIHEDKLLSNSEKLAFLKFYAIDEAKELIGKMPVDDDNYIIAREMYESNYGGRARSVSQLYDRLRNIQRAKNEPYSLYKTFNELETIVRMLEKQEQNITTNDLLYDELLKKYPFTFLNQVLQGKRLTISEFRKEVGQRVRFQVELAQKTGYKSQSSAMYTQRSKPRENSSYRKSPYPSSFASTGPRQNWSQPTKPNQEKRDEPTASASNSTTGDTRTAYCTFCAGDHFSEECPKYPTAEKRKEQLGDRCVKCLRKPHDGQPCIRSRRCVHCGENTHNRALCSKKFGQPTLFSDSLATDDEAPAYTTFCAFLQNPQTAQSIEIRVLLDPASGKTLMTATAAARIGIKLDSTGTVPVPGLGNIPTMRATQNKFPINICAPDTTSLSLNAHVVDKIANDLPVLDLQTFRQNHPRYADIPIPDPGQGKQIDLLIGNTVLYRLLTLQKSIYVNEDIQLMSTKFGWLLVGRNQNNSHKQNTAMPMTLLTFDEKAIKAMWDLELIGLKEIEQTEIEHEQLALDKFYQTVQYIDNRYEVHYPWVVYPPNLPDNYGLALGRLKTLYRKLVKENSLLQTYNKLIEEQIAQGISEEVPPEERATSNVLHYIPHHAVIALEKSTPIRIVYDASAKVGKQLSLNDNIMKGRKWLGDLMGSQLRFRRYATAAVADIQRAFHQISITKTHRDAARYLWVNDCQQPPSPSNLKILRFKRMAFGIVASPFLLYATIQYHLIHNPMTYTAIIREEMYADNLVVSLPSTVDTALFYKEAKQSFGAMSMNLTKWSTNNQLLRDKIPLTDRISEQTVSVLGLNWDTHHDTLHIRPPKFAHLENLKPTKRIILRMMAAVFDPMGWAIPILVAARIFLRELWSRKFSWDKQLEEKQTEKWHEIKQNLQLAATIHRQRQFVSYGCNKTDARYEIHIFVDASTEAYGSVIYLRAVHKNTTEVEIIAARARLSPKATMTVPRLELLAILTGSRFLDFVIHQLQLEKIHKIYLWSDSKCALAWVSANKILPSVIEKQVAQIRKSSIQTYRYVPSQLNPADVITRGATVQQLFRAKWWNGPPWMRDEGLWPSRIDLSNQPYTNPEMNTLLLIAERKTEQQPPNCPAYQPFDMVLTQFSTLRQLLLKTAYRIWALNTVLKKQFIPTNMDVDCAAARIIWLRYDQRLNYVTIPARNNSNPAYLRNIKVIYDQHGLIRCDTRIKNAAAPIDTCTPVLLVKNSWLTKLIILDIHERNFHSGTAHTLAVLRKTYWLPHGRRQVYKVLKNECFKCRKFDARTYKSPDIAPLPVYRVTEAIRPFQSVGIDVFGPFTITCTENKTAKRWVLLITCLAIRAVHFEMLFNMETTELIRAIRRFVARRGSPREIISDNAPQFHVAGTCLQTLWKPVVQSPEATKYFSENEIKWQFIPQSAPWMGGVYERLVQTAKNAFKRTFEGEKLTDTSFHTIIIEIEAIINNRPITYIEKELAAPLLTPNHFLRAFCPAIPLDCDAGSRKIFTARDEVIKFWRATEKILNSFWTCWTEFYLVALRERPDQLKQQHRQARIQPKVGEIVVMVDPTQRRGHWRKARIDRLIQSADGNIRSAQITLATGTKMVRPVTKLAPLELTSELPQYNTFQFSEKTSQNLVRLAEGASSSHKEASEEEEENEDDVVIEIDLSDEE